jgi:hypothetical protein
MASGANMNTDPICDMIPKTIIIKVVPAVIGIKAGKGNKFSVDSDSWGASHMSI